MVSELDWKRKILILRGDKWKTKSARVDILVYELCFTSFYNPTKHHYNILKGFWVMLQTKKSDAQTHINCPLTFIILILYPEFFIGKPGYEY